MTIFVYEANYHTNKAYIEELAVKQGATKREITQYVNNYNSWFYHKMFYTKTGKKSRVFKTYKGALRWIKAQGAIEQEVELITIDRKRLEAEELGQ